jgi:hypothetical protein
MVSVVRYYRLQGNGEKAQGVIVDIATWSGKHPDYHPIVEFTAADGKKYRMDTMRSFYAKEEIKLGEKMELLYLRSNPSVSGLADDSIIGSIAAGVIGLMFLGAPAIVFLVLPGFLK